MKNSENGFLQSQVGTMESTIDSLNSSMRDKDNELEKHELNQNELKGDLGDFNQKLQDMEEELYGVRR